MFYGCWVLLVEFYYGGFHVVWVDGLVCYSCYWLAVVIYLGVFWWWRMRGGLLILVEVVKWVVVEYGLLEVVLVLGMVDLVVWLGFIRCFFGDFLVVFYFYEN